MRIKANPDAHKKNEELEAKEARKRVEKVKKDLKEFQRKQYESFLKNQQKARDLRADKHRAKDNHFEAKKL